MDGRPDCVCGGDGVFWLVPVAAGEGIACGGGGGTDSSCINSISVLAAGRTAPLEDEWYKLLPPTTPADAGRRIPPPPRLVVEEAPNGDDDENGEENVETNDSDVCRSGIPSPGGVPIEFL